jgi:hypothetical protein
MTNVFPLPEGSIEVRPVSGVYAAVMVFDHGYGSKEFARGALTTVVGEVFRVMKEGVTFGPHHEPGAPFRWFHFPHDDSYRATVHDGEFRVVRHDGGLAGIHVRRREGDAIVKLERECDLAKMLAAMEKNVEGNAEDVPLAIMHHGRRGNLKVSSRPNELLAYQADETTRYFVTARGFAETSTLLVWRDVDGVTDCLKIYDVLNGYDPGGLIWSSEWSSERKEPQHRLQASRVPGDARVIERPQTAPLDTGIATACDVRRGDPARVHDPRRWEHGAPGVRRGLQTARRERHTCPSSWLEKPQRSP